MTKRGQVKRTVRNVDDMLYLFTGKRLKDVVGRGINIFGDQITKKATSIFTGTNDVEVPEDSPYRVLGVHPETADFVVRAAYKSHVKRVHPDVGGDPEEFKKIQEAYERICLEREISK